jgi:hypothetical protein
MNPADPHTIETALRQAETIRYRRHEPQTATRFVHAAVERAITLRRLSRAAETTGFLALPLDQYLARLAYSAEVALDDVLSPAKGSDPSQRIAPWIYLAGRLQLAADQMRLWVRAWFAAEFSSPGERVVFARGTALSTYGTHRQSALGVEENASPQQVEAELRRVEGRYTPAHAAELERALRTLA